MDHGHGGHNDNGGHGDMDMGPTCKMHMLWCVVEHPTHQFPIPLHVDRPNPSPTQEHPDRGHLHRLQELAHILALRLCALLPRHHLHLARVRVPPRVPAQRRSSHRTGAVPRQGARQECGEWADQS